MDLMNIYTTRNKVEPSASNPVHWRIPDGGDPKFIIVGINSMAMAQGVAALEFRI